jgi:hypothetical protein
LPAQRKAINGAAPESASFSTLPAPRDANDEMIAPELMAEMRRLLSDVWPVLREAMPINETRAFACRLEQLGHKWDCQALVEYALILIQNALLLLFRFRCLA